MKIAILTSALDKYYYYYYYYIIRNAAGVPVLVCPTNPKEPYEIEQATKPPQPVKHRVMPIFLKDHFMKFPEAVLH